MQLGQTIQKIRKQNNMTQEQFAKLFHVTRQTVSNWENEKSYPDLLTLVSISDNFNISLDNMLKENSVMTKKLNNQIKLGKIMKIFMIVLVAAVVIAFGARFLVWNHYTKSSMEKFTTGLEQYEYSIDESGEKSGYYNIEYGDDTYFGIPHHTTIDFFSFATDFYYKVIICDTKYEGETVCLTWTGREEDGTMSIVCEDGNIIKDIKEVSNSEELKDIIEYGTELYNSIYK